MTDLQSNLIDLRREKNLTQKDVAEKIGVSASAIGFWETGINEPKATYLMKLANFFGVTVDELLGRDELTQAERAAGLSETRKMNVTPIEEDAVYIVRQIGKRFGEQAQRDYLTVGENMLKLK